jgi:integrase
MLTVSRVLVEVMPQFHPEGCRYFVRDYPKGKKHRRLKISAHMVAKVMAQVRQRGLGPDDLIFTMAAVSAPRLRVLPDPDQPGFTEPNGQGRRYRHGTASAYGAGGCRCAGCRAAVAAYRAQRRAEGKDSPRSPRVIDGDGHISRNWFRNQVWLPAAQQADLVVRVRFHDLRHAHASWILAGGADLAVVKERLGYSDISTTQRYLHALADGDDTALDALSKIRNRRKGQSGVTPGRAAIAVLLY